MPAEADATRPSLLLRIRDPQDADSWSNFVDLYSPLLQRYARKRGLQEADAADVTQDVLVQLAKSIRSFEYQPERGRFRDWLGTVVRHRVLRFFKREANQARRADGEWLDDLPATQQDSDWSDAFNAHILNAALEHVRPHFEETTWGSVSAGMVGTTTSDDGRRKARSTRGRRVSGQVARAEKAARRSHADCRGLAARTGQMMP